MKLQHDNENLIINYLLGALSEAELQNFERSYLQDEELFQELQEVEEELIDDYVSGALPQEQRTAFEQYFLKTPERREKVQFARVMAQVAGPWKKTLLMDTAEIEAATKKGEGSDGHRPKSLGRDRSQHLVPAWREWVAVAAAIVFAVIGGLLLWNTLRLRRELSNLRQQEIALRQSEAESRANAAARKTELDAEQQQSQKLDEKIDKIVEVAPLDPTSKIVVAIQIGIDYLTDGSKGQGEQKTKTVVIPAKAQLVRLGVEFGKSEFQTFKATLRRDRTPIWTRGGLKARSVGNNQGVTVAIPADKLAAGDYDLVVSGVTPEGNTESLGRYSLRIVRK